MLPVSILIGFLNPFKTISFVWNLKNIQISSFVDFLNGTFYLNWIYLLGIIFAGILLVLTLSVILSGVDYHMRTGKFSYKNAFKRMHYFLLPVISLFAIFAVFSAIIIFLMPAISYFIHYFFAGLGASPTNVSFAITVFIYVVGYLLIFMFLSIILMAINLISLNGYSVKGALSNSLSLLEGSFFKFLFALLTPYVLVVPVVILSNSLSVYPLFSILLFALQFGYIVSLSMTAYFEFTKTARKDNQPAGYFGSRGEKWFF